MTGHDRRSGFDLERARTAAGSGSRRFWSSLDELIDAEGFREWLVAEFPTAAPLFDEPERRQVLKLMGASLLLGGLGGCSDEGRSQQALPYVNQPEEIVPGVARYYATAVTFEGYAQPVLATSYAGRPTKLDGNPEHPVTRGKSDAFMQSALFSLYDPERSKMPLKNGSPATWANFTNALTDLRARWQERGGEGLRILTGATTSPTMIRQLGELAAKYPKMQWHRFEPAGSSHQDEAMHMAFGLPVAAHCRLDQCEVVVSLADDLLGPGPHQVMHARGWANRHGDVRPGVGRMRLHVAESVPSLTGTVASTRLPCDGTRLAKLAQALAAEFGIGGASPISLEEPEQRWLEQAIAELRGHQRRGLLIIGPTLGPLQALAPVINERLNNAGTTVWYSEPIRVPGEAKPLARLVADIGAGAVETIVIADCNPAYSAPGALHFSASLAGVPTRIHAGLHVDETAQLCQWHLPLSHMLESWSDARAIDGTTSIIQPVITPLNSSRSIHQLVGMLRGEHDPATDAAVRATWQATFDADFEVRWRRALHDGFVEGTAATPLAVQTKAPSPPQARNAAPDSLEIIFAPDPCVWDGRFANISWLQELPKPLTKITWDNVVAISPALAAQYGVSNGDLLDVTVASRSLRGPAWIVPGQAPRTVALYFGYGRRAGGDIAQGQGYDAFALRPDEATWSASGTIARAAGQYQVATTQAHHRMDGFDFVREVTTKNPNTPPPKANHTLYPDWNAADSAENKADHAWAMAIDLDLCIGCNACVSACNVENNVMVVGKDQVARGREMLWLRIDRYYTGDPENPRGFFQPVPCMHCEKAPCEMGCPVHATVHSPEGVNQMVYNRCIGTRTCSSYCPYKVRRFNWYDYRHFSEAEQAAKNPDVTVRSRGVMEKCTYCTQRIEAAHVRADKENRTLHRDEVVTACQQACPTQAIVFGDLRDEGSAVSKRRKSGRHYVLLEELGTRPRTTYLARWDDSSDKEGGA